METLSTSPRTKLTRKPQRGTGDREALYALLDEALVCHVGLVRDGAPVVLPTAFGRDGDRIFIHASTGAGMTRALTPGGEVCLTVTLLDGLVLARSATNHSMNYRSAVVFGEARRVEDPDEQLHGLRVITEHLVPGRWPAVREPSDKELAGTAVFELPLAEASVKARSGPPLDEPDDLDWPVWAGVVPLSITRGAPEPAPGSYPE